MNDKDLKEKEFREQEFGETDFKVPEKAAESGPRTSIPVIIPAYEPDERLLQLLDSFQEQGIRDVVLVDDGSGDAYREIFREAGEKIARLGGAVLTHEVNRGKGRALKTAFAYVLEHEPDAVGAVTADSDGQHDTGCIRSVMEKLREEPEALVLGVRTFDGENVPWKSAVGNKLTMKVLGYVSGVRVTDTQTGLRGIPRRFMRELLDTPGERFEFETQMLLATTKLQPPVEIREVPIRTIYDSKENHQTHFHPLKDSIRIYRILGAKFIKYLFTSLSSSVLDLVLFALFCRLLKGGGTGGIEALRGVPYVAAATVLARVLSATYNFSMNYKVVFRSRENVGASAARYILLAVIQMTLSAVLVTGGTGLLPSVPEVAVKAVVDTVLFLISYYVQRKYVF
ncbi:MAG: bifunctional glycosyltransferase family 2/GtrA family protein [Eubacteriales bacterium]|nr:bifunctional glycosyltransferase family 2/GtrA family protein [Eubacteriales bacterium]